MFRQGLFLPGSPKNHFTANIPTIATSISAASRKRSQQHFLSNATWSSPESWLPPEHSPHCRRQSFNNAEVPCHSPASDPSMFLHCIISTNIYWEPCTVLATMVTSENKTEKISYIPRGRPTNIKDINSMLEGHWENRSRYRNQKSRGWASCSLSRVAESLTERWHLNKHKRGQGASPVGVWRDGPGTGTAGAKQTWSPLTVSECLSSMSTEQWEEICQRRHAEPATEGFPLGVKGCYLSFFVLALSLSFLCSTILIFQFLKSEKHSHKWFPLSGIF